MWLEILKALREFLQAETDLNGTAIVIGLGAAMPNTRTISLIRGTHTERSNDRKEKPQQVLYVECWETDSSANPEKGYEKLADLEAKTFNAINRFGLKCIDGIRIQVRLAPTEPDGDAFRPNVGSRTAVTIRWQ